MPHPFDVCALKECIESIEQFIHFKPHFMMSVETVCNLHFCNRTRIPYAHSSTKGWVQYFRFHSTQCRIAPPHVNQDVFFFQKKKKKTQNKQRDDAGSNMCLFSETIIRNSSCTTRSAKWGVWPQVFNLLLRWRECKSISYNTGLQLLCPIGFTH